MTMVGRTLNTYVAVILTSFWFCGHVFADESHLDELYDRLKVEELAEWESVQEEIWKEWSKSGSDAMDLLLKRGREALDDGETIAAIEHFTALTDHAPDFAEGYHMRATAYFQAGMMGPSLADLRTTIALNPRHFGAMSGLGTLMMEMGREEEALFAFRQALALNPHREDLQEAVDALGPKFDGQEI